MYWGWLASISTASGPYYGPFKISERLFGTEVFEFAFADRVEIVQLICTTLSYLCNAAFVIPCVLRRMTTFTHLQHGHILFCWNFCHIVALVVFESPYFLFVPGLCVIFLVIFCAETRRVHLFRVLVSIATGTVNDICLLPKVATILCKHCRLSCSLLFP